MRECIFVIGTRAQLVKLASVLSLACGSGLQHVVWFTGQHDESIDDLIDDMLVRIRMNQENILYQLKRSGLDNAGQNNTTPT